MLTTVVCVIFPGILWAIYSAGTDIAIYGCFAKLLLAYFDVLLIINLLSLLFRQESEFLLIMISCALF
jgi:hypothetical protein